MTQSCAIVSTLRDAKAVLDSFIRYHRAIGFGHFFLFFDDPDDAAIPSARSVPDVTVVVKDDALRARWQRSRYARARGHLHDVDREVMTRQILNVEVAAAMAYERGIDWLLHIDSDELFYCDGASAPEHFEAMSDRNIARVVYRNHEAAPERDDVVDFFREATLFRRNPSTWEGLRLRPSHRALLADTPQLPPKFFNFYANGKAAARVHADLWTQSVHDFEVPPSAQVGQGRMNPAILHYPCCGWRHFLAKYTALGRFADTWFGSIDIRERIGGFHLDARDVVATGDVAAMRAFYHRRIVLADPAVVEPLLGAGVLLRLDGPARLLAQAASRQGDHG